ncbi:hypothetical protein [Phyllobacterium sp. P5_D12]
MKSGSRTFEARMDTPWNEFKVPHQPMHIRINLDVETSKGSIDFHSLDYREFFGSIPVSLLPQTKS